MSSNNEILKRLERAEHDINRMLAKEMTLSLDTRRIRLLEEAVQRLEKEANPLITVALEKDEYANINNKKCIQVLESSRGMIESPKKKGDVGYNVITADGRVVYCVCLDVPITKIHTGVFIKLPPNTWALLTARSGAVFNRNLLILPGVIDEGFTGEIVVPCVSLRGDIFVPGGTSIAQLVLFESNTPELVYVDKLPTTERGQSGFGSTDDETKGNP